MSVGPCHQHDVFLSRSPYVFLETQIICRTWWCGFPIPDRYFEIQCVKEDIFNDDTPLNEDSLWQLMVFLYFGCGGCRLQPWKQLKDHSAVKKYMTHQMCQPLNVMQYVQNLYDCGLKTTEIFGGDGLNKKSRKVNVRMLYEWHKEVPRLMRLYANEDKRNFISAVRKLPEVGPLTEKEFYLCLSVSPNAELSTTGKLNIAVGPGALQGGRAFGLIEWPSRAIKGLGPQESAKQQLERRVSEIGEALHRKNPRVQGKVSLGDLEIAACTILNHAKLIEQHVHNNVPVAELKIPPGWVAYSDGEVDKSKTKDFPIFRPPSYTVDTGVPVKIWLALKKRPASKTPPACLLPTRVGTGKRTSRGLTGTGDTRKTTAKGTRTPDRYHMHQCTICKKYVGARCKVHCNVEINYYAKKRQRCERSGCV